MVSTPEQRRSAWKRWALVGVLLVLVAIASWEHHAGHSEHLS